LSIDHWGGPVGEHQREQAAAIRRVRMGPAARLSAASTHARRRKEPRILFMEVPLA
jgi:hypothetical protein